MHFGALVVRSSFETILCLSSKFNEAKETIYLVCFVENCIFDIWVLEDNWLLFAILIFDPLKKMEIMRCVSKIKQRSVNKGWLWFLSLYLFFLFLKVPMFFPDICNLIFLILSFRLFVHSIILRLPLFFTTLQEYYWILYLHLPCSIRCPPFWSGNFDK